MSKQTLNIPSSENVSLSTSARNLKATASCVDTGSFLLRLAGKQKPEEKPNVAEKPKAKSKEKRKNNSDKNFLPKKSLIKEQKDRKQSAPGPECQVSIKVKEHGPVNSEVNDHEEMDEATLATFRDLFNMLDQSNTGIITVDNLYEELRHVDSDITYSEVEDVLKKVDKDGNGEIDFDEFLYHMTRMGGEPFGEDGTAVNEDQKRKYKRRQRLVYSAITQFSIKQTLADIEKTFKTQAPHVISHYSAGVRLIGLTTRQLERQMKRMQKTAGQNDSPYAKPLLFVHMGAKKKIVHRKNIKSAGLILEKSVLSNKDLNQSKQNMDALENVQIVENLSQEITNTMKLFTQQRGSIVSKIRDANLIMQLRQKIGKVKAKMQTTDLLSSAEEDETGPALNNPSDKDEPSLKRSNPKRPKTSCPPKRKPKSSRKKLMTGLGWTTPRIQYMEVPLPSMKMKRKSNKPTFNDFYRIRAKANEAINNYYHNLRQTEIRNAWDHWDRLYADVILPKKLLKNFRTVYSAYSPHREEEAFVVCPWKPGPFRYIRHMPKNSSPTLPKSPDFMEGRRSVGAIKTPDLVERPLSSMSSILSLQI